MRVEMRRERRFTFRARGCPLCLHTFRSLSRHMRVHVELVTLVLDAVCNHCAQEHGKLHAGCGNRGCACPCPAEES